MEVLKKSRFNLQMGNCPIPVAEDSGQNLFFRCVAWAPFGDAIAKMVKGKYLLKQVIQIFLESSLHLSKIIFHEI